MHAISWPIKICFHVTSSMKVVQKGQKLFRTVNWTLFVDLKTVLNIKSTSMSKVNLDMDVEALPLFSKMSFGQKSSRPHALCSNCFSD